ncbi:MAG: TIGR00282 family metallophosphoesterase [Eubacteriaceae bacterium]|jgi:metallophosphoesterase (TIGR00282 family)|nr:TIGR00282 family metallophosphoesterase [Eubacteriaceae bacterium]
MKILALGDIFGRPGRSAIIRYAASLKLESKADFVIANIENASGGAGLNEKNAIEMLEIPEIDCYTSGNHIWDKGEVYNFIQNTDRIVRPANYPEPCPGNGFSIFRRGKTRIGVISLSGNVYMGQLENPFRTFDKIHEILRTSCDIICVDFHAEATSEKIAFGYYVDGRAHIVFGTHTHVLTADERVLDGGCGYITDLGMCGPYDGVIGVSKDIIVKQFVTQRHSRFEVASGRVQLNGAVFDIDEETFRCRGINIVRKVCE